MNYLIKLFVGLLVFAFVFSCKAQKIQSSDFTPEFSFTKGIEGPAVDNNGNLYAVNFKKEGTIGIVDEKGNPSVFVNLPEGSIGNGIRFDKEGNMFIADYSQHNVLWVKKGTKEVTIWAHNENMSQPNDLAMAPNGTIYLSDPNWTENTGRIWMVSPAKEIVLLEKNMGTTNGIEVSPNGKKLYVNESNQRIIWEYKINSDGTLFNKQEFIKFTDFGLDGMRCDTKGNLYVTRYDKGTVLIMSSDKKILKEVQLKGKKPSNITFGGLNGKTCFVTMADRGCFETFQALNSGAYFNRIQ